MEGIVNLFRKKSYALFACLTLVPAVYGMDATMLQRLNQQLMDAVAQGSTARVRDLIAHGAEVDYYSDFYATPLMQAAFFGHQETVVALLALGADVHTSSPHGRTALMWSVENGHTDTARLLIQYGANPNFTSHDGRTALFTAVFNNDERTISLLLESGASAVVVAHDGMRPIDYAAEAGPHMINLFLRHGVSVDSIDAMTGETVLSKAATGSSSNESVRALLLAGADFDCLSTCCGLVDRPTAALPTAAVPGNQHPSCEQAAKRKCSQGATLLCPVCSKEQPDLQLVRSCQRHRVCRHCLDLWNRHRGGDCNQCPQCAGVSR